MKYLEDSDYSMNAKDIDQSYLLSFQNHCLGEDMRPTSLNHYIRDIRAFVYWCVDREYVPKGFKIKQVSQQETIKETYTDEEKLKLIARPSKYASFVEWRSWAKAITSKMPLSHVWAISLSSIISLALRK